MAPQQKSDASQIKRVSRYLSNIFNTGALLKTAFKLSNDYYYIVDQLYGTFFLVKDTRGKDISANFGTNLR
jgi:hypothetical protein